MSCHRAEGVKRDVLLPLAALVSVALAWLISGWGSSAESWNGPPKLLYRSGGDILSLDVKPDGQESCFLVSEWVGPRAPGNDGAGSGATSEIRLRLLDVTTGQMSKMATLGFGSAPPAGFDGVIGLAADGRLALSETRLGPGPMQSVIRVRESDGSWRQVNDWDGKWRIVPRWSPDSRHLAYFAHRQAVGGRVLSLTTVVADVPVAGGNAVEKDLRQESSALVDVRWSKDGLSLYHLERGRDRERRLSSIDVASGEEIAVFAADWIGYLMVAENSGDVVWLASDGQESGGKLSAWRLLPKGKPERTPLRLDAAPREAAISPDGSRLAVAPEKGGLVICDLTTGSKKAVREFTKAWPWKVQWALGGHALVFVIEGQEVWLAPTPD